MIAVYNPAEARQLTHLRWSSGKRFTVVFCKEKWKFTPARVTLGEGQSRVTETIYIKLGKPCRLCWNIQITVWFLVNFPRIQNDNKTGIVIAHAGIPSRTSRERRKINYRTCAYLFMKVHENFTRCVKAERSTVTEFELTLGYARNFANERKIKNRFRALNMPSTQDQYN